MVFSLIDKILYHMPFFIKLFYIVKGLIPRRLQIYLRRKLVLRRLSKCSSIWPINQTAAKVPDGWRGWPNGKQFAVVLTHDVELEIGRNNVRRLAELEMSLGFRSSFNFVPLRYQDDPQLREWLVENGFEVGVHDLRHDGKLFRSYRDFKIQSPQINNYIKKWNVCGFRAGAMHHNLEWISNLNIKYDASTFDTDPFEPQSDGVNTIFPFFVQSKNKKREYVELPYTLAQDFTLFVIMQEKTIRLWKEKLKWISEHGGMSLVIVHPDYINFADNKPDSFEKYSIELYSEFLQHIKKDYKDNYWNALPREVTEHISNDHQINSLKCLL